MSLKPHLLIALPALAAAAVVAGPACAQPLDLRLPDAGLAPIAAAPVILAGQAPRAAPDLANPLDPMARPVVQTGPMDGVVFARTAVDHRFAGHDNLTGALGFLCGRQPSPGDTGGASAYGVDPHGRFVGAKLSLAFR